MINPLYICFAGIVIGVAIMVISYNNMRKAYNTLKALANKILDSNDILLRGAVQDHQTIEILRTKVSSLTESWILLRDMISNDVFLCNNEKVDYILGLMEKAEGRVGPCSKCLEEAYSEGEEAENERHNP